MAELSKEEKHEKVRSVCDEHKCCDCPLEDTCNSMSTTGLSDKEYCAKLYDACIDFFEPKHEHFCITIRDLIDLLDHDRLGIRPVRVVDVSKADLLQSRSDSYLLEYIGDTPVNAIDVVEGVLTMYVNYGKSAE